MSIKVSTTKKKVKKIIEVETNKIATVTITLPIQHARAIQTLTGSLGGITGPFRYLSNEVYYAMAAEGVKSFPHQDGGLNHLYAGVSGSSRFDPKVED